VPPLGFAWALPFQPPLIPHFLFNRLTLGGIEAAATIGGAELDAMQSALTEKLRMPKAPQPAAEMAFDRPVMIAALFVVQDAPTPG